MTNRRRRTILRFAGAIALITAIGLLAVWWLGQGEKALLIFSGDKAMEHAAAQMEFGPRPTGSEANRLTGDYILRQLQELEWQTETQEFSYKDTPVRNIIGKAALGQGPVIIVGAHYDTRRNADQDLAAPLAPVPGANDGASGVAVLLELARVLETRDLKNEVWLAFFDAEDNGRLDEWEWIVGSTYMANSLTIQPEAMILADMIGDADQQIYLDANSDEALLRELFQIAADLGYAANFIPESKWAMLDDHTPFAQRGIPSADLIDFDYPHWHTTADTLDKISPASLERVGRVIEVYLEGAP
jgi:Zn-dependent M28 family amino/carboxypeptidase